MLAEVEGIGVAGFEQRGEGRSRVGQIGIEFHGHLVGIGHAVIFGRGDYQDDLFVLVPANDADRRLGNRPHRDAVGGD